MFIPLYQSLPNLIEKWQEDLISIAFEILPLMTAINDTIANLSGFEAKWVEPLSATMAADCLLNLMHNSSNRSKLYIMIELCQVVACFICHNNAKRV